MIYSSPASRVHRPALFDGYVRLTFNEFLQLAFSEKRAWHDESLKEDLTQDDIFACRAGYCEWATSHSTQIVSIGWAWFGSEDNRLFLAPGGISSNVMLVTSKHYDLGMQKTSELLLSWLSDEQWQPCLADAANGTFRGMTGLNANW